MYTGLKRSNSNILILQRYFTINYILTALIVRYLGCFFYPQNF